MYSACPVVICQNLLTFNEKKEGEIYMDVQTLLKEVEELYPKMVEIRKYLHQNPELSFKEERTAKFIADYLTDLDIEVQTKVGENGVVGLLRGKKEGKTIAIRADFDALPIQDEKDVPYKSTVKDVMHACGHDGHTATLLAAATVLAKHRDELAGNVVFLHQHAEEQFPGGAKSMIEAGCLDGVDIVIGSHLQSTLPAGVVYYREGYTMASADMFNITISGKGGHGASPHETVDPLVIGSQLVTNLQQIVSRNVDPIQSAVITVGSFHSGEAPNVIPDTAVITGSVRSYDPEIRDLLENRIKQLTESTCAANGATCEIKYDRGYASVYNHPTETKYIKDIATEVLGEENVKEIEPKMGSEDFGYFIQEKPGTFFFTGARLSDSERVYPHHHPRFDFDEEAMISTAKVFVAAVAKLND